MTVGRSFLRALIFASLVVGGCDREPFESSVRQALQTLGHRLTFFAVPKSGWTVAATIERRSEWHGMADPRLHGESAGY